MAGTHCLKVISYAFKEIELKVLNELMHQFPLESEEFREVLESDLVYLATFGLLDPLRDNIVDAVQLIRYGFTVSDPSEAENQVNVRMVSGDHLETARQVAIKVGIITKAESTMPGVCITGAEFLEKAGGYEQIWNPETSQYHVHF
jgi:magnesium-transporting ATPase (P-type)